MTAFIGQGDFLGAVLQPAGRHLFAAASLDSLGRTAAIVIAPFLAVRPCGASVSHTSFELGGPAARLEAGGPTAN